VRERDPDRALVPRLGHAARSILPL